LWIGQIFGKRPCACGIPARQQDFVDLPPTISTLIDEMEGDLIEHPASRYNVHIGNGAATLYLGLVENIGLVARILAIDEGREI
jgi:hypothetical protein